VEAAAVAAPATTAMRRAMFAPNARVLAAAEEEVSDAEVVVEEAAAFPASSAVKADTSLASAPRKEEMTAVGAIAEEEAAEVAAVDADQWNATDVAKRVICAAIAQALVVHPSRSAMLVSLAITMAASRESKRGRTFPPLPVFSDSTLE